MKWDGRLDIERKWNANPVVWALVVEKSNLQRGTGMVLSYLNKSKKWQHFSTKVSLVSNDKTKTLGVKFQMSCVKRWRNKVDEIAVRTLSLHGHDSIPQSYGEKGSGFPEL